MFERYTERSRHVVILAQEEARALQHNYIGTEHMLLGLLREEEGFAAQVLDSLDVTVERVRAQVVRIVGPGEELTSGQIPFTPRAQKILELALREALSLGHNYVGTEHILLGLVREDEGVAARILLDFDADSGKIRSEVMRRLSGPGARPSVTKVESEPVTRVGLDLVWLDGLGPGLEQLAGEIRATLSRDPDAGDLLLALACAPELLSAQALEALDVDLDALWGALEHVRVQANSAREQAIEARRKLHHQIHEVRVAKERAIGDQEFARAARLRDQERQLTEEQTRADRLRVPQDETLRQIRRRLGIPVTDDPDR